VSSDRPTSEEILNRVAALGPQGADFTMARGAEVRIHSDGNALIVDRPGVQPITRSELETALEFWPLRRVGDLPANRIHGVSYLFALLRDERVTGKLQPDRTFPIAVADATRRQQALDSAKATVNEMQLLRDEAVSRAYLRGASTRELAGAMGVSPETISQIVAKTEFDLFRVEAKCGMPGDARAMLDALGPVGEVLVVRSLETAGSGLGPGSVVLDVPARSEQEAVDEVADALGATFPDLRRDYPISGQRHPPGSKGRARA